MENHCRFLSKRLVLTFLLLINSVLIYSQVKFEKGYIIDMQNNKVDAFVKDTGWLYNPTKIKYKLGNSKETLTGDITNIKGFKIENGAEYALATVKIEEGTYNVQNLTSDKVLRFTTEKIFLRVLYTGKISLYEYGTGKHRRYIISRDGKNFEQLINKPYLNDNLRVTYMKMYRDQLKKELDCATIDAAEFNLEYDPNEIIKLLKKYNDC